MLTDPQIAVLVERYLPQMAHYEQVAGRVESRLRRALRAQALRVLLSSRVKHPDDLRAKLSRRRAEYVFPELEANLDQLVFDLAGCRVLVYHPSEEALVASLVAEAFPGSPPRMLVHRKATGYRATHVLVSCPDDDDGRSTVCEVQVSTIASHVFNELEHDIGYKDHTTPPGPMVKSCMDDVLHATRLLDRLTERVLDHRRDEVMPRPSPLENAQQLKRELERVCRRALRGDFARLYRLLEGVFETITVQALDELDADERIASGAVLAERIAFTESDDVVHFALGLLPDFPDELPELAARWRGPRSSLKRAILMAAGRPA